MTATVAVAERNGEEETRKEGNEDQVVTALVQILGSPDPKTAFLGALETDAIPDDVCLELAEHLDELVKAVNFDNRLEIVIALHKSGAISEKTEQYLLLAILEMDEQEQDKWEGVGETETPIQESPAMALQAPPANLIADLIGSAAELQVQFGTVTAVPEEKLSEIRQAVAKLTEEEFSSLRQILGSAILAQAEVPADQRRTDVAASLDIVGILLGSRQTELTAATFAVYEALANEGFRLTLRNGYDRPLMTVSSIALLRNRFRKWLDSRESILGEEELVSAQKTVATLEGFLLAAADDYTKAAIQRDRATRLRERIVSSQIRVLDAISEEMVIAQPATKEKALQQIQGYLHAKRSELASELRLAEGKILAEAEATIRRIFDLHSATAALRQEMAKLEVSDYNPLAQRPTLSDRDKRLAIFELERKELVSIYGELEAALDEPRNRDRKKLQILLAITASKLSELNQLIAGLRPAPELDPIKLALPVTGQGVHHG